MGLRPLVESYVVVGEAMTMLPSWCRNSLRLLSMPRRWQLRLRRWRRVDEAAPLLPTRSFSFVLDALLGSSYKGTCTGSRGLVGGYSKETNANTDRYLVNNKRG